MQTLRLLRVCADNLERAEGLGGYDVTDHDAALFLFDAPQRMAFCGRGCDVDLYVNCVEGLTVKEAFVVQAGDLSPVYSDGDSYRVVLECTHNLTGCRLSVRPGFVGVEGA